MAPAAEGLRFTKVGPGRALLGLLLLFGVVQFLLGMYVNLYAPCLPNGTRYVFGGGTCAASTSLEAHVVVGVVMFLLALGLLVWGFRSRIPGFIGPAFGGFLGIVIAAMGGYEFLATNPPAVVWSFVMAVGFLVAFGAYSQANHVLDLWARSSGAARGWTPPTPGG